MINLSIFAQFYGLRLTFYTRIIFILIFSLSRLCIAADLVAEPTLESNDIKPRAFADSDNNAAIKMEIDKNAFSAVQPLEKSSNAASLSKRVSVVDAIELARINSPQLRHQNMAAERQKANAELASLNYSTDFDVQLSSNLGKNRSELDLYDEHSRRHLNSVTLQATLPWWYKAEYQFDEKIARVGESLAVNSVDIIYRRLDVDIYIAYFDAVLQQSKIRVKKARTDVAKQRLDNTVKSFELGRASQWLKVNDESNYFTQVSALKRSETELFQKIIRLGNLIGIPYSGKVTLADDLPLPDHTDLKALLDLEPIFTSDPNVNQLTLQLDQKRLELAKIDKTVWKPKLSLKAAYYDDGQYDFETDPDGIFEAPPPGRDATQMVVGATLSVPIPTFNESHVKKRLALAELEDLKASLSELKRSRLIDVENKKTTLQRLNDQLGIYTQLVRKNAEKAEFARQSFEIGKLTNLELQNIESLEVQSAEEYYETLFSIRRTYAELCWLLNISIDGL